MRIRTRITLWITLAGLTVGLFFSLVVYWEVREQAFRALDNELKATIRNVYQIIRLSRTDPAPAASREALEVFYTSRRFWIKAWHNHQLIYSSRLADLIKLPAIDRKKATLSLTIPRSRLALDQNLFDEVTFRVRRALVPARDGVPACRIQVALPMEKLDKELDEVLLVMGLGLPAAALLLTLISWLLAGRILKPVQEITARAREIDEKGLADRLPVAAGRKDELAELATALNQMLDRLQHSFRRQQEFIAGAAHELNTPLTSLRLFSEQALAEPDLTPELRARLTRQHDILLRMGRLLRSLMLLSALEVQPRAEIKPFDLGRLIRSVLEDLEPLIACQSLTVVADLPDELPFPGDEEKLRRVVVNLVENAVKYNVAEGEIRLKAERKGERVIVEIANRSQRPLPEEDLGKVFEQFYRVEKSRSREFGGCGLGLTIVREIVSLHDGEIRLENRPGNWIAAILILPCRRSAAAGSRAENRPAGTRRAG